jgi:hypothetical protein
MQIYIDKVKDELMSMVRSMREKHPDVELRVAFVGYRDHEDGADRIVSQDFTLDVEAMTTVIAGVKTNICGSGGGWCEDALGGLEAMALLSWRSATRLLFHVGDMPCHGARFYDYLLACYWGYVEESDHLYQRKTKAACFGTVPSNL